MKTRDNYDDYESPRPAPRRKQSASAEDVTVRKRAGAQAPAVKKTRSDAPQKKPAARRKADEAVAKQHSSAPGAKPVRKTAKRDERSRPVSQTRKTPAKKKPGTQPFETARSASRDYQTNRYQSDWDDYDDDYEVRTQRVKKTARKKARTKPMTVMLWFVIAIAIAFAVSFLINHYLFEIVGVTGDSMHETLMRGDLVLVRKVDYKDEGPRQGEIVAVRRGVQDGILLRRVIGMPGQTIKVDGDVTYINDVALNEMQYKSLENYASFDAKTMPEGKYYLMGDNRSEISDSRSDQIGLVDKNEIVGKVSAVIWPLNHWTIF